MLRLLHEVRELVQAGRTCGSAQVSPCGLGGLGSRDGAVDVRRAGDVEVRDLDLRGRVEEGEGLAGRRRGELAVNKVAGLESMWRFSGAHFAERGGALARTRRTHLDGHGWDMISYGWRLVRAEWGEGQKEGKKSGER